MLLKPCEVIVEGASLMIPKIRTYSELLELKTYKERYEYLRLNGVVGEETFGFDRYANQRFYHSSFWKQIRNKIIERDLGCDLGIEGLEIPGRITIHHMNPVLLNDILNQNEILTNPEYLICVSETTHRAIHYGDESLLPQEPVTRTPNDTCPWKRGRKEE